LIGKKIGEIDHLMMDKLSGRVSYAMMSFGGFIRPGQSRAMTMTDGIDARR
jgi:hypothetical protein